MIGLHSSIAFLLGQIVERMFFKEVGLTNNHAEQHSSSKMLSLSVLTILNSQHWTKFDCFCLHVVVAFCFLASVVIAIVAIILSFLT